MGRFETETSLEGSAVIPAEVLDALGLKPGEAIEFIVTEGGVEVIAKSLSLKSLKALFSGSTAKFDDQAALEETIMRRAAMDGMDPDP